MKKIVFAFFIAILTFAIVGCGNEGTPAKKEKSKKENKVTEQKKVHKQIEKKDLDFSIHHTKYNTNKDGYVVIKGQINKGASVEVDFDQAKVDEQGNVTFKTKLNKKTARKEFNIEGSMEGYNSKTIYVTVNNKSNERKKYLDKLNYQKKHQPTDNNVYGKLTNTYDLTKENDELYKDEDKDIMYSIVENDEIYQVSLGLGDDSFFEISKDKNHLIELARDYMEKDATLVQTISDQSFIYKSPKINKKYNVDFELNNDNKVIEILITHYVAQ